MTLAEKMLSWITDRYTKRPDSNIAKLMAVVGEEIQEKLFDTRDAIVYYQDIDNAEGKVLDRFGQDVGQQRNGMDDQSYRYMIKTKDSANFSNGDIETINEIMDNLLGDAYKGLAECWRYEKYDNEPAALVLLYETDIFTPQLKFDGTAKFDGTYLFSGNKGGQFATAAIENVRTSIRRIVQDGIRIYFGVPIEAAYQDIIAYSTLIVPRISKAYALPINYESSFHVQRDTQITKALKFDGSASFNGVHQFDGERAPTEYGIRMMINGEEVEA
ncbi:hypothetical protein [Salibacterium halotolerans]|uniref:Uncharacterized protein n=1 Tax=Salibacterium halotolerans TaxID=1884432 RepID=A0A1I5NBT9_9BACI|nr:hypothetical protein [Salibacterium halotolerans]SFP19162.1 hypothetical protein SAMN05518683_10371 [Salibacterium halotolerans]